MNHNVNLYTVCYIDKYSTPERSQEITLAIGEKFGLSAKHLNKLSSGNPVVIKQSVPMTYAKRLKDAVNTLGGCCWIQMLDSAGQFRERRLSARRTEADRRGLPRTNIEPDRRIPKDRRQLYSV